MTENTKCLRCRLNHEDDPAACPQVKAIEFDASGNVVRVEYLTPVDFPRQQQIEPVKEYPTYKPRDGTAS